MKNTPTLVPWEFTLAPGLFVSSTGHVVPVYANKPGLEWRVKALTFFILWRAWQISLFIDGNLPDLLWALCKQNQDNEDHFLPSAKYNSLQPSCLQTLIYKKFLSDPFNLLQNRVIGFAQNSHVIFISRANHSVLELKGYTTQKCTRAQA